MIVFPSMALSIFLMSGIMDTGSMGTCRISMSSRWQALSKPTWALFWRRGAELETKGLIKDRYLLLKQYCINSNLVYVRKVEAPFQVLLDSATFPRLRIVAFS